MFHLAIRPEAGASSGRLELSNRHVAPAAVYEPLLYCTTKLYRAIKPDPIDGFTLEDVFAGESRKFAQPEKDALGTER